MATVVFRLHIITRFYVSKMDADTEERQRDRISRRETRRWSMNSQRLDQIVAELMRPIGDLRRSFDTDLSALLEEYLTEAGLHALEDGDQSPEGSGSAGAGAVPNFSELALLLQQSANIYGRKVDFLYQHVLEVSESLQLSTNELSNSAAESPSVATPASARRRRRGSAGAAPEWARIALEPAAGARREAELRPPPTLPRLYADLAPRVLAPCDAPLTDYAGEPVGLLQDFHVTWRLHGGMLVDELECGWEEATSAMRPIPLAELQAAIEAAAPPSPPPEPEPPDQARVATSTPLPTGHEPPAPPTPPLEAERRRRKRRAPEDFSPDEYAPVGFKRSLTLDVRVMLHGLSGEFGVSGAWVARVLAARGARLRTARAAAPRALPDFCGFDMELLKEDSKLELKKLKQVLDADVDDGFFEQSDHSESPGEDPTRLDAPAAGLDAAPPALSPEALQELASSPAWLSWRAGVVAHAAAAEARGLDVRALGRAVLAALPAPGGEGGLGEEGGQPAPPTSFARVLHRAAKDDADVSRLFLASLFLANAGNVEVVPGPALALGSFSLRLVSADESRYCAAAAADPAFLAARP